MAGLEEREDRCAGHNETPDIGGDTHKLLAVDVTKSSGSLEICVQCWELRDGTPNESKHRKQ